MNFYCSKDALVLGVTTVLRAVSAKSTLPVLQGILLKTNGDQLSFTATDLEISIQCAVPIQTIEPGAVVLPARIFSEIVRKLPDISIHLELQDGQMHIHYYHSSIVLKTMELDEFPLLPNLADDAQSFELPIALFQHMIKKTVFACSTEEKRQVFTGVFLQIENGLITMVGTDTHRMAYKSAELPGIESFYFKGIIPSKALAEIFRLMKEEDENVTVQCKEAQVSFHFGSISFLARLIEGQFPNYKQVIPNTCETKIHLSVDSFLEAVERASLISRDSGLSVNVIRLKLESNTLYLEQNSDLGHISEQLEVETEGNDIVISINAKYLLDVLKVIHHQMVFELSGPNQAGVIRSLDDVNYLYLVLPIRAS
jgi:DNA polymerase-3 subunit beta